MKVQARASRLVPLHSVSVLYGLDWEDCEGSEGLTLGEANELIQSWMRDDRLTLRDMGMHRTRYPHEYQIVE